MQSFAQPVRKADIPENLLAWVKRDNAANKIGNTWSEVVGWDSCKLMARKQGAVTRFQVQHYGQYDCCKAALVRMGGYRQAGTSYAELPVWGQNLWYGLRKAGVLPEGSKIASWERYSVTGIEVTFAGYVWELRDYSQTDGDWVLKVWSIRLHKGSDMSDHIELMRSQSYREAHELGPLEMAQAA